MKQTHRVQTTHASVPKPAACRSMARFDRYLSIFRVSSHLASCYGNHIWMHTQAKDRKLVLSVICINNNLALLYKQGESFVIRVPNVISERVKCFKTHAFCPYFIAIWWEPNMTSWERRIWLFPCRDEDFSQHASGRSSLFNSQWLPSHNLFRMSSDAH